MPLRRRPPEGLFARLLDSLTDMYAMVLGKTHRITYANVFFLKYLGLTTCRGLIAQHHGDINLESEVNHGTTCTIRLPLQSSP